MRPNGKVSFFETHLDNHAGPFPSNDNGVTSVATQVRLWAFVSYWFRGWTISLSREQIQDLFDESVGANSERRTRLATFDIKRISSEFPVQWQRSRTPQGASNQKQTGENPTSSPRDAAWRTEPTAEMATL